ncbi:MAG: radical SAM protein [Candidatus Thorarchaeota archaeon]|nr:radical SAM protein [Candidatus Thorarchaeota archaeon]
MVQLKQSRFLVSFDLDNEKKVLVSNLTNAICVVDSEALSVVEDFKFPTHEETYVQNPETADLINQLRRGGILVEADTDELGLYERRIKYASREAVYTLVLTYDCNLACAYCYEGHKEPEHLTIDTAKKILDFISARARKEKQKRVGIGFYGGEPLLRKEAMFEILELAEQMLPRETTLSTSIATNGVLLTDDITEVLKNYNCENIQITIDGPPEIHDKRRPKISGAGTFEDVIAGAQSVLRHSIILLLRVNLDSENISYVPQFIEVLKSLKFNQPDVLIMPSPVLTTTSACKDYAHYCLSSPRYASMIVSCLKEFGEQGFNVFWREARPSIHYCEALGKNARLIFDARGDAYTCLAGLRREEYLVGNIHNRPIIDKSLFSKWEQRSPLQFEECMNCDIVGFCGGGCPDEAFDEHGTFDAIHCPYILYSYKDAIREYINLKLKYPSRWRRGYPTRLMGDTDV